MRRILSFTVFITLTFTIYAYSSPEITVFTIPNCSKCAYVINYLKKNNIKYTESTSSDPAHGQKLWEALKATGKYNGGTVYGPTVIINGKTYFNIENLESFTASIPSLISGKNSTADNSQAQNNTDADSQFIKSITERHNYYRQNHNAQPLKWNPAIQKFAQAWADKIAAEDRMYHRQPNKYGENIYWQSGGNLNGSSPVDNWYSEIKNYNYNNPGFSMTTGHFTQVVWAGSTEFGCGKASSRNGGTYIVCNYNPPGNYQGMFPKNVLPLKSSGGKSENTNSNTDGSKLQTITFSDGTKYTGQIKNGKMDGQGTLTYPNGTIYVGMMKDGKMHGKGIKTFSNGDTYNGEWKNNLKDGFGTYKWVSGSWYQGYYKNDKYNGEGTLTIAGKTVTQQKGKFKDGKFIGK